MRRLAHLTRRTLLRPLQLRFRMLARPLNSLHVSRRTVPVTPNTIMPIDRKNHNRRASKMKTRQKQKVGHRKELRSFGQ